jgi:hypothetical protein
MSTCQDCGRSFFLRSCKCLAATIRRQREQRKEESAQSAKEDVSLWKAAPRDRPHTRPGRDGNAICEVCDTRHDKRYDCVEDRDPLADQDWDDASTLAEKEEARTQRDQQQLEDEFDEDDRCIPFDC